MSGITTHVLDTSRGRPAPGIPVLLEASMGPGGWASLGEGETDQDGRARALLPAGHRLEPGLYRLTFRVEPYFTALGVGAFYPEVIVVFEVRDPSQHYHVPVLLSPFGYSTYRGS